MNQQSIRCGWCKKHEGELYEVRVTSAGKPRDSLAHKDCAEQWAQVSDVKIGILKYQLTISEQVVKEIRRAERVYARSQFYFRKHKELIDNHCACGKLINPESTRCVQCQGKYRHESRPTARQDVPQ